VEGGIVPIAPDEFEQRRTRLLDACKDLQVEALVIFANGSCFGLSGRSQGNMAFLCGWNSFDSPSALILRADKPPHLLVSHHRMKMMALEIAPGLQVDWIDQDSLGVGLRRILDQSEHSSSRIGTCGWEDVIAKTWKNIEAELGNIEQVDISSRIARLRVVKSPAQLQMQREAARLCDGMFETLAKSTVTGRPTSAVKAEIECYAKQQGAEFVQHWLSVGSPPDYPRYFPHENRQVPKRGDMLVYGIQILLDGVWGHAVRCYSVGPAQEKQKKVQDAVIDFSRRFRARMKPGVKLNEIVQDSFRGMMDPVHQAIGPGKFEMLRLGHAMGYSYTEPEVSDPFPRSYYDLGQELARAREVTLEAGMVFQIHPVFFYGDGVAGTGNMLEIQHDGTHVMTKFPEAIFELN
jgi:Xaa-Pro dipeptidase